MLYGEKASALWAYCTLKCGNAVIYGYGPHVKEKFGWSKAQFYRKMDRLVKNDLATLTIVGGKAQYKLTPRKSLRAICKLGERPHRCHLLLNKDMGEREVLDMVRMKLVEMAHRQVTHAIIPRKLSKRIKKERALLMEHGPEETRRMLYAKPLLGEGARTILKRAKGGYVPMNTKKLMKHTGMGRTALFSWKKRVKNRRWIKQVNRFEKIPLTISGAFPDKTRAVEQHYKGRVSYSKGYRSYLFHQASCYKLLIAYGK